MPYTNPSAQDFKDYFPYDFPFGTDPNQSVQDSEITKAMQRVNNYSLNQSLFCTQQEWNQGYLLLAAHFLCLIIRASGQGLNGRATWVSTSKGVGAVSETVSIPQRILDNPAWSMLSNTNYGLQFLESIMPRLGARTFTVYGPTKP